MDVGLYIGTVSYGIDVLSAYGLRATLTVAHTSHGRDYLGLYEILVSRLPNALQGVWSMAHMPLDLKVSRTLRRAAPQKGHAKRLITSYCAALAPSWQGSGAGPQIKPRLSQALQLHAFVGVCLECVKARRSCVVFTCPWSGLPWCPCIVRSLHTLLGERTPACGDLRHPVLFQDFLDVA